MYDINTVYYSWNAQLISYINLCWERSLCTLLSTERTSEEGAHWTDLYKSKIHKKLHIIHAVCKARTGYKPLWIYQRQTFTSHLQLRPAGAIRVHWDLQAHGLPYFIWQAHDITVVNFQKKWECSSVPLHWRIYTAAPCCQKMINIQQWNANSLRDVLCIASRKVANKGNFMPPITSSAIPIVSMPFLP